MEPGAGKSGDGTLGGGGNVAGEGGAPSGASAGAGGTVVVPGIIVVGQAVTVGCSGKSIALELRAEGGEGGYRWEQPSADFDLSISATGDHATVVGIAPTAGDFPVSVQVFDRSGKPGVNVFVFSVVETPVVTTAALPTICENEEYEAALEATGGEGEYEWTTDLDEAKGFSLDGNRLSGVLAAGTGSSLRFSVTARSGSCESAPVPLELLVEARQAVCPAIKVLGGADELPAPCRDQPYRAQVSISGGPGEAEWLDAELPAGLELVDSEIVGDYHDGETVTLRARDGERTVRRQFHLEPRDKCWLAYIAQARSGASRLVLEDPIVGSEFALPTSAPGSDPKVTDFAFSPDGAFLAYRDDSGAAAGGLLVVKVSTREVLSLGGAAVPQFAWSESGNVLAFVDRAGGEARLRAARVTAQAVSSSFVVEQAQPIAVTPGTSFAWYGSKGIGLLAQRDISEDFQFLSRTAFETDPVLRLTNAELYRQDTYPLTTSIRSAGDDGLWLLSDLPWFFPGREDEPVAYPRVTVAPRGMLAASVEADDLSVFSIDAWNFDEDEPVVVSGPAVGCNLILSWARSQERLACLGRRDDAFDEVNIFDLNSDGTGLTTKRVRERHFPRDSLRLHSRTFSPPGDALALATESAVYLIELAGNEPHARVFSSNATSPADPKLSFSPDGRYLMTRRGNALRIIDTLSTSDFEAPVSVLLDTTAPKCVEADSNGPSWCGGGGGGFDVAWSANSKVGAFETSNFQLVILDPARGGGAALPRSGEPRQVFEHKFKFQP